jgi:hypothetical protein
MGKVFFIPARPSTEHLNRQRTCDPRYVEGQRLLVNAMRYLINTGPDDNRAAVELISEHVRTRFRMSDSPLHPPESNSSRLT